MHQILLIKPNILKYNILKKTPRNNIAGSLIALKSPFFAQPQH